MHASISSLAVFSLLERRFARFVCMFALKGLGLKKNIQGSLEAQHMVTTCMIAPFVFTW